ncbi:hypothetical protein [Sneathiella glossodoripedis]|uniref:hypothetical protein n=1 Tax=Sneathiella glossodoripedis TaxID=418853 RepID=UPI000471E9FF|nr:hypothetical protein [Sneathiella glossodoripedis]
MSIVQIKGDKAQIRYARKSTLVMLSGGAKSTAILYDLLKNTDDIVLVHHVHYTSPFSEHIAQSHSCKKIVEWLRQNTRDFAYSESVADYKGLAYHADKLQAISAEIGLIGGNFHLKHARPLLQALIGSESTEDESDRIPSFQVIANAYAFPYPAPKIATGSPPAQEQSLPPELKAMTWNCERPVIAGEGLFAECGYCKSCRGEKARSKEQKSGSKSTGGNEPAMLIMLSGGIDSVYQLYRFLKDDDRQVIAHHINLINDDGRWQIEAERTLKIVKWCRENMRDFIYSESTLDHRGFHATGYDIMPVLHTLATSVRYFSDTQAFDIQKAVIGWCKEETADPNRQKHVVELFRELCAPYEPPSRDLGEVLPKLEQIRRMPAELVELSWTCRRPVPKEDGTVAECGVCHTCELMAQVREQQRLQNA